MPEGTMKQWVLTARDGKLSSLKLEDAPKPTVGPYDVLVKGTSSVVSRPDMQCTRLR